MDKDLERLWEKYVTKCEAERIANMPAFSLPDVVRKIANNTASLSLLAFKKISIKIALDFSLSYHRTPDYKEEISKQTFYNEHAKRLENDIFVRRNDFANSFPDEYWETVWSNDEEWEKHISKMHEAVPEFPQLKKVYKFLSDEYRHYSKDEIQLADFAFTGHLFNMTKNEIFKDLCRDKNIIPEKMSFQEKLNKELDMDAFCNYFQQTQIVP